MVAWRSVWTVVLLVAAPAMAAETYPLVETVKAGDNVHIRIDLTLTGEIKVPRDDKIGTLPLTAKATHEFPERVLAVGSNGLAEKVARHYETATAVVTADRDRTDKSLRKERQLIVAQRVQDRPLTYAPAGPLTREELELVDEHFDTLALPGLLPGKDVAVGDTWKIAPHVVQALCHLDGVTEHDLTAKLDNVAERTATFSLTGSASGVELGGLVKLKIEATGTFDLGAKRLVGLQWKQTDEREQGPASPAMTTKTTTTITRKPIDESEKLSDPALVSVPDGVKVPEAMTFLDYKDAKDRYAISYTRDWQVVGQVDGRLVLRLLDRGDFVAQATITPWTPAVKGRRISDDEFRAAVARTPGWEPEKELQAGEVPAAEGRTIVRLSMLGRMDGVSVMQNFYLIVGTEGEQVVLAVTLTPKKADQLGSRDLSLAGSLEFPAARK